MSALSSLLQLILGVTLGLLLLGCGSLAAGYFFFLRLSITPERPVFPEERVTETVSETADSEATAATKAASEAAPVAAEDEPLEPGAYRVRVTWPDGLSLRAEPNLEAEPIGGLAYDEIAIVLESSADGRWERVRLPGSNQEGWIKAGNTERIDSGDE